MPHPYTPKLSIYLLWITLCQAHRAFPIPRVAAATTTAAAADPRNTISSAFNHTATVLVTSLYALLCCSMTERGLRVEMTREQRL